MPIARIAVATTAALLIGVVGASGSTEHDNPVGTNPVNYTPNLVATGGVGHPHADAIDKYGRRVYVGGLFGAVSDSSGQHRRRNMMSFNASTGTVFAGFHPKVNGNVWAVEATRKAVYVGGAFNKVNGRSKVALVKLDPVTGAIDRKFKAHFKGRQINDIELRNGLLYVGGSTGHKLMALNPKTGTDTKAVRLHIHKPIPGAWGVVSVYHFAINPAGNRLVATGNFKVVDGKKRARLFVANIGHRPATATSWYYKGFHKRCSSNAPRRLAYLQGVDFSPRGKRFIVTATGQIPRRKSDVWHPGVKNPPGTTVCDAVARFNMGNADRTHQPVWINYSGGDSMWSAADTGGVVYVQGHFRWLNNPDGFASKPRGNAVPRRGIGAINPDTGLALKWNPDKPARLGGKALRVTRAGLYVGSDSTTFNRERHVGIAYVTY